ncbi:MAG: M23 family metallopeptidase [Deltaproteobacteria bacterium]|nr:M23 family metallopeptidase [Deltaproteobacteria bacterium]
MADIRKVFRGGTGSLIFFALLALGLVGCLIWLVQGRLDQAPPWVNLQPQGEVVGSKTAFTLEAGDPDSGLKEARVAITQGNLEKVVLNRQFPPGGGPGAKVELPFTLEPQALGLKEGKAWISATVRDRSWREWFQGRTATLTREVTIDLVPLNLAFLSVNHLLHAGGTGVIRYRLNKPAKESGVAIDGRFFAGFPQPGGPQGEYVVLFALPRETPGTVIAEVVAKPGAGPPVLQRVTLKINPRRWRQDRLNLPDNFLRRVAADFKVANPGDPLSAYLEVNREMRKANHERLRQVCSQPRPQQLWSGGFQRFLGKSMARFGDRRAYMYQGKQVDSQEHLGEDLASLVHSPVPAANNGVVVLAEPLGIYGETVVLDHGLGVFSMYSHLSQIDVKAGEEVKKGAVLGKTGTTGLAGGDHLHFSMVLQGEFVDPLEWWDRHWVKDQLEGQWKKAGAPAPPVKAAAAPAKAGKGKKAKARPAKRARPPQ